MTERVFLAALVSEVPEVAPVVMEHLADNDDQLLLHVLMGDLLRFATDAFESGRTPALQRLLGLLDHALRAGTEEVNNAVAVSFVEDARWWDPQAQPFIESWPDGLRAEAERQRNWRP